MRDVSLEQLIVKPNIIDTSMSKMFDILFMCYVSSNKLKLYVERENAIVLM